MPELSPPRYSHFHTHILKVLGEMTRNEPGVFVSLTDTLVKRVILSLGFDPDKLSRYGTPEQGWVYEGITPAGLHRKVLIAYQDLHTRVKEPLTVKGVRGQWGLTETGVEKALLLQAPKKSANLTAQFLERRLRENKKLLPLIHRSVAAKMPRSSQTQVEDHVQTCMLRLISRDSLRSRLQMGFQIKDHHIVSWAIRSAYTDARDSATDAVTREYTGAITRVERRQFDDVEPTVLVKGGNEDVIWGASDGSRHDAGSWSDLVDTSSSMSASNTEDVLEFNALWGLVTQRVLERSVAGARYMKVLGMKMEGHSLQEIADAEQINRSKAVSLLSEARQLARSVLPRDLLQGHRLEGLL